MNSELYPLAFMTILISASAEAEVLLLLLRPRLWASHIILAVRPVHIMVVRKGIVLQAEAERCISRSRLAAVSICVHISAVRWSIAAVRI